RELGLEQRRARHAGDADQRIVRRDDDVAAANAVAVRAQAKRRVEEFLRVALFENLTARRLDRLRQSSQVFQRMEARLIRELDPRPADERDLIDERGIKAELIGEIRLGSQLIGLVLRRLAARRVEISIDTRERAVDLVLSR